MKQEDFERIMKIMSDVKKKYNKSNEKMVFAIGILTAEIGKKEKQEKMIFLLRELTTELKMTDEQISKINDFIFGDSNENI